MKQIAAALLTLAAALPAGAAQFAPITGLQGEPAHADFTDAAVVISYICPTRVQGPTIPGFPGGMVGEFEEEADTTGQSPSSVDEIEVYFSTTAPGDLEVWRSGLTPVSVVPGDPTTRQTVTLSSDEAGGLTADTDFHVSVRYRIGTQYSAMAAAIMLRTEVDNDLPSAIGSLLVSQETASACTITINGLPRDDAGNVTSGRCRRYLARFIAAGSSPVDPTVLSQSGKDAWFETNSGTMTPVGSLPTPEEPVVASQSFAFQAGAAGSYYLAVLAEDNGRVVVPNGPPRGNRSPVSIRLVILGQDGGDGGNNGNGGGSFLGCSAATAGTSLLLLVLVGALPLLRR